MQKEMEQFILQRINDCGKRESEGLQDAYNRFKACTEKLKNSLNPEQEKLYLECENAYALVDGETMQCYYRAGFSDAVMFLMGWRDGEWK